MIRGGSFSGLGGANRKVAGIVHKSLCTFSISGGGNILSGSDGLCFHDKIFLSLSKDELTSPWGGTNLPDKLEENVDTVGASSLQDLLNCIRVLLSRRRNSL